jgi:hypothetical protein
MRKTIHKYVMQGSCHFGRRVEEYIGEKVSAVVRAVNRTITLTARDKMSRPFCVPSRHPRRMEPFWFRFYHAAATASHEVKQKFTLPSNIERRVDRASSRRVATQMTGP